MLKIYNTLTRQKEIFQPIEANKVKMYVCGITVYDYCHIGHARTFSSADIIVRYLKWSGFDVHYVRNITDIDDKIIKRATENNETIDALTARFIAAMHEDFSKLQFQQPNDEPRATQFISQMIKLVEAIIDNGYGYIAENGDVYFNVRKFPNYGCLSHHNIDQLESGARVSISEVKKDPLDFVLWKIAKANEPAWDSPWGKGRPGWHLECSAMSMSLLGENFDIHGGARDLIFPHHENEIAQSQAATQKPFANVWIHGGFLQIEKEKMSKSLGNFITIRDVLKQYSAEVIRYLFSASHYRSPLIYAEEALHQAKQSLERLYTAIRFLPQAKSIKNSAYEKKFIEAMNDDFNTPVALSILFEIASEINRIKESNLEKAAALGALLKELGEILGIMQNDVNLFFQSSSTVDIEKVEHLIAARNEARANKNWNEADRVRKELEAMSVVIEDGPNGTTWKSK